ncbi:MULTISPECIES: three-helix bundle dimerization domain-containing protein [unclassified Streptomyces]|uniref:three-helix bundle dimerization domain-containing protein n=1 Tax=unclassified Streptomyces TaxID=2593676 RepID=UPI003869DFEB|nr:hypothetical protein OG569_06695 [Streptomyces sp. NBC_00827]
MTETPYGIEQLNLPVRQGAATVRDRHCRDTRPAAGPTPAAERRGREDVQGRLTRAFPDTPPTALAAATAEAFVFFSSARIRHYVPVLAFKRASRRLAEHPSEAEAESG